MLTTTTMNKNLERTAAIRRLRLAPASWAAGFVAALFLVTMSAPGHMAHAAMSAESATPVASPPTQPVGRAKPTDATSAPQPSALQATREDYQKREASSKDVGDFAGGGAGIYIGGSSAAVILLLVLLIILL